MKSHLKTLGRLCVALVALAAVSLPAQVNPVLAGALSPNAGAGLAFINDTNLSVASGFVQPLMHSAFANRIPATNRYYFTTGLRFQALSSGDAGGAAVGANLVCEVVSVTGPAGGVFAFWEQGEFWPTYNFPVGGTFAPDKSRFDVSDIQSGAGRPDGDPVGNIPGRRFSVTKSGEYLVTFRLHDISANHPTVAGPIHEPSDPLTIKFVTGTDLNITRLVLNGDQVATLTFRQSGFTNLFVDASPEIDADDWWPVAGPFASSPLGNGLTSQTITNDPSLPSLFYRLRAVEQ